MIDSTPTHSVDFSSFAYTVFYTNHPLSKLTKDQFVK